MEYFLRESHGLEEPSSIIEDILFKRGFKTKEEAKKFLCTSDADILSPCLLDNMDNGVKMLIKHLHNGGKIMNCVDDDCDGQTSSAILLNYLHRIVPTIVENNIYYVFHEGKSHGISSVMHQIKEGTTLIIAPDSSSNEYETHKILREKGIDVLVLDHHMADHISEDACVINNWLCDYPTKSLSGAGIVYKFCSRIDEFLGIKIADDYLDLAAVGIIADVMSLKDLETKRIIEKGLQNIRNPFITKLIEKNSYKIKEDIIPFNIAFYIAPYINAVTRIGTIEEKKVMFESFLEWKSFEQIPSTKRGCKGEYETIVEQAVRQSSNIKNRQKKMQDQIFESIDGSIQEELNKHKIIAVLLDNLAFADGLRGIVANKIASQYQKPTLILAKTNHDGEYWYEGSARGYGIEDFKQSCIDTGFVEYAEGHKNAYGIGIKKKNIENFLNKIDELFSDYNFTPKYYVDFIIDASDFDERIIYDIYTYRNLWGQQVEEPYIAIQNVKITEDTLMLLSRDVNPTLKMKIKEGVYGIKFKSSAEEYEDLVSSSSGYTYIDIVGRCSINEYNGVVSPQILIEDYTVTKIQKYYF